MNTVFRGFKIIPLTEKLHLYAQKQLNAVWVDNPNIEHFCAFYENYYLHSESSNGLTQTDIELLYSVFIGYPDVPEPLEIGVWEPYIKSKMLVKPGQRQKVSVQGKRKRAEEPDSMGFVDVDYEDFEHDESLSTFGRVTP